MIQRIINNYFEYQEEIAKSIIAEIKKDCITYKDVCTKLDKLNKKIVWEHGSSCDFLLCKIAELLEEEKNDLSLTNRS